MEYRWKQFLALLVEVLLIATGLTLIGRANQTIWKFDSAILAAFLFGDYALRPFLRIGRNGTFLRLLQRPNPPPSWTRLGLASATFLLVVLLIGEAAYLGSFFLRAVYAGTVPLPAVVLVSLMLSLWLAVDFRDNYIKKGVDEFWENMVP